MFTSLWRFTMFTAAVAIIATVLLSGCASTRYRDTHQLSNLKVVFLDAQSLAEVYKGRSHQPATRITMKGLSPVFHQVTAFYDHENHTIYCRKWDFKNCGHELHHAVLGNFHTE